MKRYKIKKVPQTKYTIKKLPEKKYTIETNDRIEIYSSKDLVKDEANLATSINALVEDENAAIKAYEVAIENLRNQLDDTSIQVLENILKDERKHVENLYAILNNQVTKKNLEE